ncbi:MAG: hypothetical protein H6620_07380 [Halobacteriovoraceae bacterium]|nr:hypothetical protein [Halobacteriovoraceae bacterium]
MSKSYQLILTGFEPFGGREENISQKIVDQVSKQYLNEAILCLTLPVSYEKAYQVLKEKILEFDPKYIIAMGLAANRDYTSFEKYAHNQRNLLIADNEDYIPTEECIFKDETFQLCSTLSFDHLPSSEDAGTYVCNDLLYKLLKDFPDKKITFIHLPSEENQAFEITYQQVKTCLNSLL